MNTEKYWIGSTPSCDFCKKEVTTKFIDGKTKMGPWALMCPAHHSSYGLGVGPGIGQQYQYRASDKKWVKVAG